MDSGEIVALTNLLFPPMKITWSPDGTQIAFSAPVPSAPPTVTEMPPAPPGAAWAQPATVIDRLIYRFDGIGYSIGQGYMHVFVMPAEGGTPRQISKGDFHHPFPMMGGGIEWTRDGQHLLVSANRRDEVELEVFDTEIYEFAVADGEMKAITSRRGPDGSPKVSPDGGTIAYLGYDDRYVSHQVSKIQGWIIKPPDFNPSKKYPLILEIHGGPVANYGDRFSVEKQLLASAGYVVLYANPRGSTSYGEEFGNLIHHKYPGNDFDDLDSGVDAVIAKEYIDEDNLFVTGGSAGGIMTCWMIGKTDRFRAAATLYPVVNWYSTALTSDIPFLAVKYEFPGFPWDHPEEYMKFSPISLVGNVKTPTIVICGEEDWRCPIVESEQYYLALKMQGIETVMVRFPGASHGIANRPSQHMSKMLHIISWFDRYREE